MTSPAMFKAAMEMVAKSERMGPETVEWADRVSDLLDGTRGNAVAKLGALAVHVYASARSLELAIANKPSVRDALARNADAMAAIIETLRETADRLERSMKEGEIQ